MLHGQYIFYTALSKTLGQLPSKVKKSTNDGPRKLAISFTRNIVKNNCHKQMFHFGEVNIGSVA